MASRNVLYDLNQLVEYIASHSVTTYRIKEVSLGSFNYYSIVRIRIEIKLIILCIEKKMCEKILHWIIPERNSQLEKPWAGFEQRKQGYLIFYDY